TEGREQHDGRARPEAFELAEYMKTVHRSHPDVRQHEVDRNLLTSPDRVQSVAETLDVVALLLERFHQQLAGNLVVIDHQNFGFGWHGPYLGSSIGSVIHGQRDHHLGAFADLTVDRQSAPMRLDNFSAQEQAEAAALSDLLGGKERLG